MGAPERHLDLGAEPPIDDAMRKELLEVFGNPPTPDGLAAALSRAGEADLVTLTLALHPCTSDDDQTLTDAGWVLVRDQRQLRRPLPLDETVPSAFTARPFDADRDSDDWLEVNRRAFAWHPDQGTWRRDDLDRHLGASWFDPAGFLVHDGAAGRLDGFCWTKVHPQTDADPALGEIFVIGVDPVAHGTGLGRSLVTAGLDHLASAGLTTAMLYVESDNVAARRLYDSLGFTEHERHRWYRSPTIGTDL